VTFEKDLEMKIRNFLIENCGTLVNFIGMRCNGNLMYIVRNKVATMIEITENDVVIVTVYGTPETGNISEVTIKNDDLESLKAKII
jgi:hypothetical protein